MALRRFSSIDAIADSCANALERWREIDGPGEIEDAVIEFVPNDEPLRAEVIGALLKVRAAGRTALSPA